MEPVGPDPDAIVLQHDDLSDGAIEALLQRHLQEMHKYSPPESIHALDSEALRDPRLTFWSLRSENELLCSGAIKEIGTGIGEIKSMKTAEAHVRKGLAKRLLRHMLDEAKARDYTKLYLETGSHEAFLPARRLYEQFGFKLCGPFGEYILDPYSVFYEKDLQRRDNRN